MLWLVLKLKGLDKSKKEVFKWGMNNVKSRGVHCTKHVRVYVSAQGVLIWIFLYYIYIQ